MKKLLKLFAILSIIFCIFACGNAKLSTNVNKDIYGYGGSMSSLYDMTITQHQLDSICYADSLSTNFKDWIGGYFIDYETRDTIYRYTFIKTYNKNEEILYVVTKKKNEMNINKRIKK